jgi:hypothetical protein
VFKICLKVKDKIVYNYEQINYRNMNMFISFSEMLMRGVGISRNLLK